MKLAVSSYSFNQAMLAKKMSMTDVIPKAKELGFAGIEIVPINETSDDMRKLAPILLQQSKDFGVELTAYLVTNDFLDGKLEDKIDKLKAHIDAAALMNIPRFRNDATAGKNEAGEIVEWEDALPVLAEGYRNVADYAQKAGILSLVENHGFYAQHSERIKQLVETVDHENFGWLCDIGNFICADEDPASAVRTAAPYTKHAHAKDFFLKPAGSFLPNSGWKLTPGKMLRRATVIGHGNIPIEACLKSLHDSGYNDWISIEFEGLEDCFYAISEGAANLKTLLKKAGYQDTDIE